MKNVRLFLRVAEMEDIEVVTESEKPVKNEQLKKLGNYHQRSIVWHQSQPLRIY